MLRVQGVSFGPWRVVVILTVTMSLLNAAWLLVSTQLSLLPKNNQIKKNKHISHIISDYHQLLVYFLSSSSLCLDENG